MFILIKEIISSTKLLTLYFFKKRVQILNHGETYIYYSIKKNRIEKLSLKNKKLKKTISH